MDKKSFGLLGMAGLACIACCAAPVLALLGISTTSLAAFFSHSVGLFVAGSVIVLAVIVFTFRKQISSVCGSKTSCSVDCGCKSKS